MWFHMPRDLRGCLRIIQALQANGATWMASLKSRAALVQSMHYYMTRIGISVDSLPHIIHIAGTKGKGSTAAFTESILRQSGLKTGLYTSPHLISLCERYRIDGKSVDTDEFLCHFWRTWDALTLVGPPIATEDLIEEFRVPSPPTSPTTLSHSIRHEDITTGSMATSANSTIEKVGCSLSSSSSIYNSGGTAGASGAGSMPEPPEILRTLPSLPGFHFLTLVGFQIFISAKVDVLVLEVGLGGRLDATNVVANPAVCGISTLDFDHVELLGYTLSEIAREKAGIFKAGVPAVTVPQSGDAMSALAGCAVDSGTPLFQCSTHLLADRCSDRKLPMLGIEGDFQAVNASLAVALTDIYMHQLAQGRLTPGVVATKLHTVLESYRGKREGEGKDTGRRSSFSDSFGASCIPSLADVTLPVPTYDNKAALSPVVLAGLARARWPGRTQVVPLDDALVASTQQEDVAQITLYLDGAHTQHSMLGACSWFLSKAKQSSSSRHRKQKWLLVFNCGADKDIIQLMLPLATIPFSSVSFTTVPWLLTPRVNVPSLSEAYTIFVKRRRLMGDALTLEELGAAAVPAVETDGDVPEIFTSTFDIPDSRLAWQHTLMHLYRAVQRAEVFRPTRQRLRCSLDPSENLARSTEGSVAPLDVQPSMSEVLNKIRMQFKAEPEPTDYHVFVTGSLYLVGHCLETVHYAPDELR